MISAFNCLGILIRLKTLLKYQILERYLMKNIVKCSSGFTYRRWRLSPRGLRLEKAPILFGK